MNLFNMLHNEGFPYLCTSSGIVRIVRSRMLRWTGCVVTTGESMHSDVWR
jgi:hypothetical protein